MAQAALFNPVTYSARFRDPSLAEFAQLGRIHFRPARWSWTKHGGPEAAEIVATGPWLDLLELIRWIDYDGRIRDVYGTEVWSGYVYAVEVAAGAGGTVGASAEKMANAIRVRYTYTDTNGQTVDSVTDWAEDPDSVGRYGRRELVLSLTDTEEATAEQLRDNVLDQFAWPAPITGGGDTPGTARILLSGYASRLRDRYYYNPDGLIEFTDPESVGSLKVGVAYTADTIYFDPTDDIHDNADPGGLGFLEVGDHFSVSGSTDNDGSYIVDGAGDQHITVEGADIVAEGAGDTVTITPHSLQIGIPVDVAGATWTVAEIEIRIRKIGSPADSVAVDLCSGTTAPGSVVETATVSGADIPEGFRYVSFVFGNTNAVQPWIRVRRTGSASSVDYYEIEIDTAGGAGAVQVWNGSTWAEHWGGAGAVYRVHGELESSVIMADVIGYADKITATEIVAGAGTGITVRQYRDGSARLADELAELIELGTAAGFRLFWTVNSERRLTVNYIPSPDASKPLQIRRGGILWDQLLDSSMAGRSPIGQWVDLALDGLAPSHVSGWPVFLESAEFDAGSGTYTIQPEGAPDPWQVATLNRERLARDLAPLLTK